MYIRDGDGQKPQPLGPLGENQRYMLGELDLDRNKVNFARSLWPRWLAGENTSGERGSRRRRRERKRRTGLR